uniref:Uncharacterized protein n=1 Tax=Vespula pensylvanica TaxID=30213 RepID=A0A834P0Z6_VESPE|nr:hypothetical protein H0235_009058 [Vespula pensylvanica]
MRLGPRGTKDTIKLPGTVFTADDNPANHIALIEISHVSRMESPSNFTSRRSRNRQFCDMPLPLPRSEQAGEED